MVQDGTGKTTAAKIFARAINCLNSINGEPCNECINCKNILAENTTDVVEMDAASNNSVENIRSIRQEVIYATTSLKYRVYIIDEAHMLSTSAFNALLKTLEEPPENVVFILATTEENKILPTILSRCVRFEFKKISKEDISTRLAEVLKKENIDYQEEAINYIAKIADGGMRDGLTILERCIDPEDKKVAYKKVIELIGNIDKDILEDIAVGILTYNVIEINKALDKIMETGRNLRNVSNSILSLFMELLVYNVSKQGEISNKLQESLKNISNTRIGCIIDKLATLDDMLRQSLNLNIIFKAAILELSIDSLESDSTDMLEKIKSLELKIKKLENRLVEKETSSYNKINTLQKTEEIEKEKQDKSTIEVENKLEKTEDVKNRRAFKDLAKVIKLASDADNLKLYSALADVQSYEVEDKIIFETKNSFAHSILRKQEAQEDLKKILQEITEKEKEIQIKLITEEKDKKNEFETVIANSGVPFEIID